MTISFPKNRGWTAIGFNRWLKLSPATTLTDDQRQAAIETLQSKCSIYAAGCRKRGRLDEAEHYEKIAREGFLEPSIR